MNDTYCNNTVVNMFQVPVMNDIVLLADVPSGRLIIQLNIEVGLYTIAKRVLGWFYQEIGSLRKKTIARARIPSCRSPMTPDINKRRDYLERALNFCSLYRTESCFDIKPTHGCLRYD